MCFHLFTNSLNYLQTISNPISSTPTNGPKTTKLNVFTNSSNYIKSHKFNTHERPHAQSSRIKLPSTLPVFLITGATKRTA